MIWITKYRHNKIVEQYQQQIDDLREALNRKDLLTEIVDKLTNKTENLYTMCDGTVSSSNIMSHLDDTVPRYVDDYFGGKVIKQEATPVTVLDENGKATYGLTAKTPDKGRNYKLIQK